MRRGATRLAALVAALLLAVCGLAGHAHARVIGVVFDDSGSMRGRIHTPAFGVQLLASTLDGQSDRLLTLRLSDVERAGGSLPAARVSEAAVAQILGQLRGRSLAEEPLAPRELQATVDRIRQGFAVARANSTPYVAIEVMLAALTETIPPGDVGYLVVITDGAFKPEPPAAAYLRSAYDRYKTELSAKAARLTVDFLAIGLSQDGSFFREIDDQCVRPLLLSVFNGGAGAPVTTCQEGHIPRLPGYHNVTTVEDLVAALKDVVADISGTARRAADRFVRIDGDSVTVDSPLSIARMITIATATRPDPPPQLRGQSFPAPASVGPIALAMDQADEEAPGIRQSGTVTQFVFAPRPLPAGAHRLRFDRAVGHQLQLVFQTAAGVELEVVAADGSAVPRDGAGRPLLAAGVPHTLIATIVDDTPAGRAVVPLASLRGPVTFTATLDIGAQRRRITLTRDGAADRAVGEVVVAAAGDAVAAADAAIEGFVTLSSPALRLVAIDGHMRFETALRGLEACPDCPPGTVRTTIGPHGDGQVADMTITPRGTTAGRARLDRSGVPPWLTVVDAAGQPLADGAELGLDPDRPIRLRLAHDARSCAGIAARGEAVALALKPLAPLSGEARVEADVRVVTPAARLAFDRPTGPTDAEGRLVTTAFGLVRGDGTLAFSITGACAPPQPREVTATPSTTLVGAAVRTAGETIAVVPRIGWWCACLAWIDGGARTVAVAYRGPGGLQTASAEAPFVVAPTAAEHVACALMLVVLAWLAGTVIVALRTQRFPRGSIIEIREGNQIPRYVDLRGLNWTVLKAAFWPVRRLVFGTTLPHERCGVEGLSLIARRGGLVAEVDRDTTDFELRGQRLSEMRDINPKLRELRINWREEIEIPGKPRIFMRFLRSMADATQAS